ncbi:DUF6443 domain-containing protein, partial [Parapedobacter sp. 10938]|uniref:DUF6443 domain-containing protein n=1 Tax=Parapedobacter flavus TaxID=3110225 RepID=UPI002DBB9910
MKAIPLYRRTGLLLVALFLTIPATRAQLVLSAANMTGDHTDPVSITLAGGFSTGGTFHAYISGTPGGGSPTPLGNWNYIQTFTYLSALASAPANPLPEQAMQDVRYFDGLGRQVQEVQVKAVPGKGKDVVVAMSYDAFGRADKQYLPYATATGLGGAFKSGAAAAQATYYNNPPSGSGIVKILSYGGTTPSYSQLLYEPSPLDRVREQGFAGSVWHAQHGSMAGSGHTVRTFHTTNNTTGFGTLATTRRVARYGINLNASNEPALTLDGYYASGQLEVAVVADEGQSGSIETFAGRLHTTEEYTDKLGRVVLRRTFNQNGSTPEMLSTYYVYDDYGNLGYVLPPAAEPDRASFPTDKADWLDQYAYQYRYDMRNRLSHRRLPGTAAWENYIYNGLDQVVFHQDSRQQDETYPGFGPGPYHWFQKYDVHGRVVMRGVEKNHTAAYSTLAAAVGGASVQWEGRSSASGNLHGYTKTSLPNTVANLDVLEVHYYDDYSGIPGLPHNQSTSYSGMTKGQLVATKAKVLGTSATYLWTVYYYDDRGQVVREWKQHYLGGSSTSSKFDDITREYNFAGQLEKEIREHHTTTASTPNVTIITEYDYDHRGRQTHTWKTVNTGTRTLIARNTYNEVGQLRNKGLHSTNGGTSFGQAVTYSYNERGWLRYTHSDLFRQLLRYGDTSSNPQYTGNISHQVFMRRSNTGSPPAWVPDTYSYTYDALNRLKQGAMASSKGRETLTYDRNGNIKSLVRTGTNSTAVDNLTYTYTGNRLTSVVDGVTSTDAAYQLPGTTDYTYDANGNMKTRTNTGSTGNNIAATTYNYLNLPQSVTATVGNVTYTYDGTGRKLRSVGGILGQTRDYIDGIEYYNGTMELIH